MYWLLGVLSKTALLLLLLNTIRLLVSQIQINEDVWTNMDNDIETVVTQNGFHFENHTVITEDGYILQIHRIRTKPRKPRLINSTVPVVFFMHGSFQSSFGWIMAEANHSLSYRLANSGYDVWMGNARGNRYSRQHITLNPDQQPREFFDFSFHEIGLYDMPASVDYIRNQTGSKKLHVITHSQGSASVYVMLSERPEYNMKIQSSVTLAPGLYITHGFQPDCLLRVSPNVVQWLLDTFKWYELFPYSDWAALMGSIVCRDESLFQPICGLVVGMTCGFNYAELNTTLLPVVFTSGPCGVSWKQVVHYSQLKHSDRFQMFDQGPSRNIELYGQAYPLEYNLKNVDIPTAMFYSDNDWPIAEEDFLKVYRTLPNIDFIHKESGYAHMDYFIGKTNHRILDMIEQYLSAH